MKATAADAEFWKTAWVEGRTRFHQKHGCPDLREHWAAVEAQPGERVLVPLCGKSKDLLWLAERGHSVLGVEFSELAARAFFEEAGLQPSEHREGPHVALRAPDPFDLTILIGDFFDLTRETLGPCRIAYDRAAVVALPPELRPRYLAHLASLLGDGPGGEPRRILFITIAYNQDEKEGPPFSVPTSELEAALCPPYRFLSLVHRVGSEVPGPLGESGLGGLEENVLLASADPGA